MPPRHAYWTIILEEKPTAFRAHTRDELVPTFKQLQARHPDAVLMWFARGRLWPSQEHEREDTAAKRQAEKVRRGAEWRPGGAHRDPRDRFKVSRDEKRRRFAANVRRDRMDGQSPGEGRPPRHDRPFGDNRPPREGGPPREKRPFDGRPPRDNKPGGSGDRRPSSFGNRPPGDRPRGPRPHGPKGPWRDRPPSPGGGRPPSAHGDRPRGPKPSDRPRGGSGSHGGNRRPAGPRDRRNPRGRGGGGSR